MSRTLSDDDVRAVAAEVLRSVLPAIQELLAKPKPREWRTAAQVAEQLNVSLEWVYNHKPELGAKPLTPTGEGKRPRWRFHPDRVDDMQLQRDEMNGESPRSSRPRAQLAGYTRSGSPLLPIRDAQ